jgi:hypothetical protein
MVLQESPMDRPLSALLVLDEDAVKCPRDPFEGTRLGVEQEVEQVLWLVLPDLLVLIQAPCLDRVIFRWHELQELFPSGLAHMVLAVTANLLAVPDDPEVGDVC